MRAPSRPRTPRRADRAVLVVVSFLALLASGTADAYVRTHSPDGKYQLLWVDARITMTLRTSGPQIVVPADFHEAATRAAATWSAPSLASSVTFTIDASADAAPGTRYDHVNTISFRTDGWGPPMYPPDGLALTTVWSQAGDIVDADTEINAADPSVKWGLLPDDPALAAMALEVDLQNALTHELGHVLGLAHPCTLGGPPHPPEVDDQGHPVLSCDDPALPESVREATMFPSSTSGSISERTLSPDEVKALHDLYPAAAPAVVTGPELGSRGGCRVAPGRPPGPGPLALLVGAIVLLRRRR
jgi:MYXO-CTERM domain-containing protein